MRSIIPALIAISILNPLASAQTYTRHEVSLGGTYTRTNYYDPNFGGITGRYTFNLRPELAIESSFTFYPQDKPITAAQGGRSFAWFTGLKAGIRRQRWGLYGKAAPGLWHFTSVPRLIIPQPFDPATVRTVNRGRTHFVLDLGGVLEFYPSKKWFIRTDVSEIVRRDGDDQVRDVVTPTITYVFPFAPGKVTSAISVSGSVGYRFGQQRESAPSTLANLRRLEAGMQYAFNSLRVAVEMQDNSGLGGWASFYLNKHIAIDGAITHFWTGSHWISQQSGGNYLEGVAGAKLGISRERFGAYAKVRPGVLRFSHAVADTPAFTATGKFQPVTQFAIDMGGVLEFYPSRHLVVRADLSDLTIHYGSRAAVNSLGLHYTAASHWDASFQTSFGFGWRF